MKDVLVVDDSKTQRLAVKLLLNGTGFAFHEAEGGAQALELLKTRSFDVILTDLTMPEMDGLELIRLARELPSVERTPIVVMTTRGTEEDVEAAITSGATGYITKPVNKNDLLALLERQTKV